MFANKINKALIIALAISLASPAHAWDLRGWFNGLSENKRSAIYVGAVAVIATGIGYLMGKCWAKKKRAEAERAARCNAAVADELIESAIREVAQEAMTKACAEKKQAEEKRKQEEDKQKKEAQQQHGRQKELVDWFKGLTKPQVNELNAQIKTLERKDGTLMFAPGQTMRIALRGAAPLEGCSLEDLQALKKISILGSYNYAFAAPTLKKDGDKQTSTGAKPGWLGLFQ